MRPAIAAMTVIAPSELRDVIAYAPAKSHVQGNCLVFPEISNARCHRLRDEQNRDIAPTGSASTIVHPCVRTRHARSGRCDRNRAASSSPHWRDVGERLVSARSSSAGAALRWQPTARRQIRRGSAFPGEGILGRELHMGTYRRKVS